MKIKLTFIALLLPTFVFAQSGKENAGYQGTMSAKDGLGAAAPMDQAQGQGNAGYQGTMSAKDGLGAAAPMGQTQGQGNTGNQGLSNELWGGTVPGAPVK